MTSFRAPRHRDCLWIATPYLITSSSIKFIEELPLFILWGNEQKKIISLVQTLVQRLSWALLSTQSLHTSDGFPETYTLILSSLFCTLHTNTLAHSEYSISQSPPFHL